MVLIFHCWFFIAFCRNFIYNTFMKRIDKTMIKLKQMFMIALFLFFCGPVLVDAEIYRVDITGPIESITAEYITSAFQTIKKAGNGNLIVIILDTPGGFDTSMRDIIKEILASPVPVAVYVSPRGARAASAGFLITIAADIACMAPGTNMGAAHPVSVGGSDIGETMKDKVTNDAVSYAKSLAKIRNRNLQWAENAVRLSQSFTAEECLNNNVINIIANDLNDLISQLDGQMITMASGKPFTIETKNQKLISIPLSYRQQFLKTITNPNLAYFLLIFGLLGLYLEFSHPGILIPGILGGICLLLAFLAFQVLPVNYVGLLLILLSVGLFIAEIKIQGFGILGVGGIIAFILGSIMLIDTPIPEMKPAMSSIITLAAIFGAIILFLTYQVLKVWHRKPETGQEGMIGEIGTAKTEITTTGGKVFVHGEWWNAFTDSPTPIAVGAPVIIQSIHHFTLKVIPKGD